MKRMLVMLALSLVTTAPLAAQRHPPAARAELAQRVQERFLQEAARQLRLDEAARGRLAAVLSEHDQMRQALQREGRQLRGMLVRAVADARTPDAEFQRLLAQLDALRTRELEVWRHEQSALANVLTPRQQAEFAMLRARFAERIARIRAERPPPRREQR